MTSQVKKINQSIILYDDRLMNDIDENIFETDFWKNNQNTQAQSKGRGTVYFVKIQDQACVLRHYNRGGLVLRLVKDHYLWRGENNTRSFKEWYLLQYMLRKQLPDHDHVVDLHLRNGILYRPEIIPMELNDIESLTEKLTGNSKTEKFRENKRY